MDSLEPCWLLFRLKKYELAEAKVLEYLAKQPGSHDAYGLRALICLNTKRLDEALIFANRTVELAPADGWSHYILSSVLLHTDDHAPAIHHAENAVLLAPYSEEMQHHLVSALIYTWNHDRAHRCIFTVLSIDPRHAPTLREYGKLKCRMNEHRSAELLLRYALSLNPEDEATHEAMGWLSLEQNQTHLAFHFFRDSLAINPQNQTAEQGFEYAEKHRAYSQLPEQLSRWIAKLDLARNSEQQSPRLEENEQSLETSVQEIIFRDMQCYLTPEELTEFQAGKVVIFTDASQFTASNARDTSSLTTTRITFTRSIPEVPVYPAIETERSPEDTENETGDLSPRVKKIILYSFFTLWLLGILMTLFFRK